jgi:hypothetical protein
MMITHIHKYDSNLKHIRSITLYQKNVLVVRLFSFLYTLYMLWFPYKRWYDHRARSFYSNEEKKYIDTDTCIQSRKSKSECVIVVFARY